MAEAEIKEPIKQETDEEYKEDFFNEGAEIQNVLNLDIDNTDEERKLDSEGNKHRQMALKNKRPGGVEASLIADRNTGLDMG